jgi:hypothetical protein
VENKKERASEVRTGKSPPNVNTVWDGLSFRWPISFCFVTVHPGQRKIAARSAVLLLLFFAALLFVVFFCHRMIEILFVIPKSERALM